MADWGIFFLWWNARFTGRVLDDFALVYISCGRGSFESDGIIRTVIKPGHAFLLFPSVWHRYQPAPKTGWHEHWISFNGETARNWRKNKFIPPAQPLVKVNSEDVMLAVFCHTIQAVRANRPALQQTMAGASVHLMGLCYSVIQASPLTEDPDSTVIEQALTRIQTMTGYEIDIKALAQELGLSYSRFRNASSSAPAWPRTSICWKCVWSAPAACSGAPVSPSRKWPCNRASLTNTIFPGCSGRSSTAGPASGGGAGLRRSNSTGFVNSSVVWISRSNILGRS
jgi:hypothetical protein